MGEQVFFPVCICSASAMRDVRSFGECAAHEQLLSRSSPSSYLIGPVIWDSFFSKPTMNPAHPANIPATNQMEHCVYNLALSPVYNNVTTSIIMQYIGLGLSPMFSNVLRQTAPFTSCRQQQPNISSGLVKPDPQYRPNA